MEEKTVAQMRSELRDFYFKKVKPNLETLNKKRKKKRADVFALILILTGFALFFLIGNIKINEFSLAILPVICLVSGAIVLMLIYGKIYNFKFTKFFFGRCFWR